jgi:nicotinate-nucleotide pyrophosphorylase (carboxylating)
MLHYNAIMMTPELIKTIKKQVADALAEDVGSGDLTAQLIPTSTQAEAKIISRESAIICGIPWADEVFSQVSQETSIEWLIKEGDAVGPNQTLCHIRGKARDLLTAERCALNFLQTLSATATQARRYADAIKGSKARVLDTRKTIPGLRLAQKYAVKVGGGLNQRIGLYDGILIKENHIAAAGSIEQAMQQALAINANVSIQIEVETLAQLTSAIAAGAKLILLDNFSLKDMAEAVKLTHGRAILEASGGVTLDEIANIANTGVDRISVGGMTKHIQAVDLSMRFKELK